MSKVYTNKDLISELHRFYDENNRVPTMRDITNKNGYPSFVTYLNHFGSWNKALIKAGFELNQIHRILDGTETCSYCGKKANEIPNFTYWYYHDDVRYCQKHGNSAYGKLPHYVIGNLDINSPIGLGRAGEILVVKTLKIGKEHDCNRISCGFKFDMYHEKYGKIDVKTSLLNYERNYWYFNFPDKLEIKTFICVGLSSDRSTVEHVWIVPNEGEIMNRWGIQITDSYRSLPNYKHWEVDPKPYNDVWQTMKLKTCNSMTDKSKDYCVEPMKLGSVVDNTIKRAEQVIDKAQYKLIDYI